jgi:hypothetical protein
MRPNAPRVRTLMRLSWFRPNRESLLVIN